MDMHHVRKVRRKTVRLRKRMQRCPVQTYLQILEERAGQLIQEREQTDPGGGTGRQPSSPDVITTGPCASSPRGTDRGLPATP
eukprot:7722203-Heterocapsa_arctica.AAC.1